MGTVVVVGTCGMWIEVLDCTAVVGVGVVAGTVGVAVWGAVAAVVRGAVDNAEREDAMDRKLPGGEWTLKGAVGTDCSVVRKERV